MHRHLRALLKQLENTLKGFRQKKKKKKKSANTIPHNTITFINVPTVKGHFGMMCKTDITIMHSNKFKCQCIEAEG